MPAEFIKCVDTLIGQGKSKESAYAICTVQYKKRHKGHTPQSDEGSLEIIPSLEEIESLGFMYEELSACKKKRGK